MPPRRGGSHEAIAGRRGRVAGLHPVDTRIAPEQRVAVVLRDAVVAELALRIEGEEVGELSDDGGREDRHVVGAACSGRAR